MKIFKALLVSMLLTMVLAFPVVAGDDANPGDIVINEVIQNPSAVADSAGEWFEIYNTTGSTINIDGWTIKDDDFDLHVIANGGTLNVAAGAYVVLCNNEDSGTNGGVTCDYDYGADITLANGDDEIALVEDAGTQEEIARIEYDGGPNWPDPNGASMVYVPSAKPPTGGYFADNNDPAQWGTSTSSYGDGDLGTPGAMNDQGGVATAITLSGLNALSPFVALSAVMLLAAGLVLLRR